MLKIRNEQMEVFEQAAIRHFEDYMVQHLRSFAPKHCEVIGEPGVRQVIRLGVERANKYEFTNRGAVCLYIELMFMFGSDFDTDPQLSWAAEILNNTAIDQPARADRLYDQVMGYLDKVAGPHNAYAIEALRRIRRARVEDVVSGGDFASAMLRGFHTLYPQKYEYVGEPPLRTLIERGRELASRYAVSTETGVALFVALMFALGHGFATDPLFPWVSGTLHNPAIVDPDKRVERLYSKMMTYLDQVLTYLGQ